jgi:hypothetical protein
MLPVQDLRERTRQLPKAPQRPGLLRIGGAEVGLQYGEHADDGQPAIAFYNGGAVDLVTRGRSWMPGRLYEVVWTCPLELLYIKGFMLADQCWGVIRQGVPDQFAA